MKNFPFCPGNDIIIDMIRIDNKKIFLEIKDDRGNLCEIISPDELLKIIEYLNERIRDLIWFEDTDTRYRDLLEVNVGVQKIYIDIDFDRINVIEISSQKRAFSFDIGLKRFTREMMRSFTTGKFKKLKDMGCNIDKLVNFINSIQENYNSLYGNEFQDDEFVRVVS